MYLAAKRFSRRLFAVAALTSLAAIAAHASVVSPLGYTPAPNNYAALVFDTGIFITDVDKYNSSVAIGAIRNGTSPSSQRLTLNANSLLTTSQPLTVRAFFYADGGAWIGGNERSAGLPIDHGTAQAINQPFTNLSTVAIPVLGGYYGTRANTGVGSVIAGSWQPDLYSNSQRAAVWNWNGSAWKFTDLHAVSRIPSLIGLDSYSYVTGADADEYGVTLVGNANGRIAVGSERAIKWRQQTIYGPTWFTTLLDNPPLGNEIAVRPQAVDGIVTVGFAHGSLSSTANTPTGIRRNWHAIEWVGTAATDMHVAASLNSVLGADSESYLLDISGAVRVGTAHGSPYGPIRGSRENIPCYPGHATRWTTSNGLTTALDLNQFLPASSIVYSTQVRSVAQDGSILGSHYVWGAVEPYVAQTVLWKPLFDHTSFRLNVPREATAYILNAHIQRSGSVSVYGKMHLGRTDEGIYTVNGGSFGGDGLIYGSIDNNSGLLLPGSTTQVLRVDGNVRLGANSRFQVRYTPTLLSSGPITLGGTLQITSPPPAIGTRRSILVSMNGIQGKFASVPRGWVLSVENGGIFHTLVGTYTGL